MPDIDATLTSGVEAKGYREGATTADSWVQYVVPREDKIVSYRGRATSARTPGRAGTTGQKLLTVHNASGSTIFVDIDHVAVDLAVTVVKAVTVLPPVIRLSRITTAPTGGTTLGKSPVDSAQTSSASLSVTGDASADGTSSATALAATPVSGITQEFAPRLITAAGYEMADRLEFLGSGPIMLRALEGVVVELIYTLATQNPITDMWATTVRWTEYTRP